jgi:hypothetical protein
MHLQVNILTLTPGVLSERSLPRPLVSKKKSRINMRRSIERVFDTIDNEYHESFRSTIARNISSSSKATVAQFIRFDELFERKLELQKETECLFGEMRSALAAEKKSLSFLEGIQSKYEVLCERKDENEWEIAEIRMLLDPPVGGDLDLDEEVDTDFDDESVVESEDESEDDDEADGKGRWWPRRLYIFYKSVCQTLKIIRSTEVSKGFYSSAPSYPYQLWQFSRESDKKFKS